MRDLISALADEWRPGSDLIIEFGVRRRRACRRGDGRGREIAVVLDGET